MQSCIEQTVKRQAQKPMNAPRGLYLSVCKLSVRPPDAKNSTALLILASRSHAYWAQDQKNSRDFCFFHPRHSCCLIFEWPLSFCPTTFISFESGQMTSPLERLWRANRFLVVVLYRGPFLDEGWKVLKGGARPQPVLEFRNPSSRILPTFFISSS